MIKISIAQLEHQRRLSLQGEEKPEFLQLADGDIFTAEQPVKYSLDVERVSGGVHVAGSVSSYLSGSCARCLQQTEVLVQNKEIELFFPVGDEEMLDISGDIREELLLNLPMNILCKDDCAGLCPVCGCNNNTTPCSCSREKTEEIPADTDDSPSPWDVLDTLVDK
jgi:uncharacterized protein